MRTITEMERTATDLSIILSVERGLGILGESGKETTLHYLQLEGVKIDDIPFKLQHFTQFLEGLFGRGAPLIEDEIETSLRRLENLSPQNVSLDAAVRELRERGPCA
jgi:hypothetical protein